MLFTKLSEMLDNFFDMLKCVNEFHVGITLIVCICFVCITMIRSCENYNTTAIKQGYTRCVLGGEKTWCKDAPEKNPMNIGK